jgi:hypothetical protein
MNLKQQILRYWLAMNASAFDAAAHACAAFLGVAGAHAAMDTVPALNLRQLAAVFLITFGRAILAYLEAHPVAGLPATGETSSTQHSTSNIQPRKLAGEPPALPSPQPSTLNPQPRQ